MCKENGSGTVPADQGRFFAKVSIVAGYSRVFAGLTDAGCV
jgi:hypothetical protein